MNRRKFLGGLGGAAATVPFLSMFQGARAAPVPNGPRQEVIVMAYPMGIARQHWVPSASGFDFTLPYTTEPLTEFVDRCVFISNVDNKVVDLGQGGRFGHQQKQESSLTGTLPTYAFTSGGQNRVSDVRTDNFMRPMEGAANGPSICAAVGNAIRNGQPRRAVNFGVPGTQNFNDDTFNSPWSFDAPGSPQTLTVNPTLAFDDLFAGIGDPMTGPDPAVVAEQQRRGSVLDAVRSSFGEVRTGLDYRDRQRLDLHADYIRQIETDLRAGPLCGQPAGIPTDPRWYQSASMTDRVDIHTRMLAQAMACDMAPVGRLEFYYQQSPFFGIPLIDDSYDDWRMNGFDWHGAIHGEMDPVMGVPTRPDESDMAGFYHPALLEGLRFYVQSFANLLRELDRFEEGPDGRTVLDNSLCVLATDMGDGYAHGPFKMGYVLAGNLGPFRTGYHFDGAPGASRWRDASDYNHTNVLATIANAFCLRDSSGAEVTSFGIEGFAGGALPLPRV